MGDFSAGKDCQIDETAVVGYAHRENANPARIGDNATIRAGTIIYQDVLIGDNISTGHHALVREETVIGDDVIVGTHVVIDGAVEIGSEVSLQTGVYVPRKTTIGDAVFIGPQATLTNDPYPLRVDRPLQGPVLEDNVSIGANATLLPGIVVEEDAFVAAGAIVTQDVPQESLAIGAPARIEPLPDHLGGGNG